MGILNLYQQIKQNGTLVTFTSNREIYLFYDGIVTCKTLNGKVKAIVIEPARPIKSLAVYTDTDSVKESES